MEAQLRRRVLDACNMIEAFRPVLTGHNEDLSRVDAALREVRSHLKERGASPSVDFLTESLKSGGFCRRFLSGYPSRPLLDAPATLRVAAEKYGIAEKKALLVAMAEVVLSVTLMYEGQQEEALLVAWANIRLIARQCAYVWARA